jgi:hypothetical protein
VTNFWMVMGECKGRAGEPTESRGVGGIKVNMGMISFGMLIPDSEEDVSVAPDPVDQLVVRSRVLTDWKWCCSGSSKLEINGLFDCASDLLVFLV